LLDDPQAECKEAQDAPSMLVVREPQLLPLENDLAATPSQANLFSVPTSLHSPSSAMRPGAGLHEKTDAFLLRND